HVPRRVRKPSSRPSKSAAIFSCSTATSNRFRSCAADFSATGDCSGVVAIFQFLSWILILVEELEQRCAHSIGLGAPPGPLHCVADKSSDSSLLASSEVSDGCRVSVQCRPGRFNDSTFIFKGQQVKSLCRGCWSFTLLEAGKYALRRCSGELFAFHQLHQLMQLFWSNRQLVLGKTLCSGKAHNVIYQPVG